MKNNYPTKNKISFFIAVAALVLGNIFMAHAQVAVPFTQRTSQYTPAKEIYNIKGDFTMIGNTSLTLENYGDLTNNNNNHMVYVDTDASSLIGLSGVPTFNSSASTVVLSTENGAIPSCSNIVYAGLYWTGRCKNSGNDTNTFDVSKTINGVNYTKTLDKQKILLKGPNAAAYTTFNASSMDIFYPNTNYDRIYSAYVEVTDYVRTNGIGQYFAADIATREGNGGGTGFSGGWGMIIVYENSKMKYRDVTIFDGHAYVLSTNPAGQNLPVTGFNTVQVGPVGVKLGMMASEGDVNLLGDYFNIRKQSDGTYIPLSHSLNSSTNFFNGSVNTGGNPRNPTILNNTGMDICMFNVPNPGNTVLGNSQTATNFKYGTAGDTYAIFAIAMAVDAYIPEVLGIINAVSVDNVPVPPGGTVDVLPGQEVEYKIQLINRGSEPINNAKFTIPVPYNSTYVANSAVRNIYYTPVPTPNSITFLPTAGANGSIVWDVGHVPLPGDPDTILGDMRFKLKATEDCTILKNANCGNILSVNGTVNGVGAITGAVLQDKDLILGFTTVGLCQGVELHAPLNIAIDAVEYVNANCQSTPPITAFTFCNSIGTTIPITDVTGAFPAGSLFYNEYPVTSGSTQYNINNGFPATLGTRTYYAVPAGVGTGCYFQFTITVTTLTTQPTVANVQYCQGATAVPLTATPTVPGYELFYYTSPSALAQTSITPSTATVGTTTYYVAQGQSAQCIGPKRPITVTVYAVPNTPLCTVTVQPTCTIPTGSVSISGLPSGPWTLTQTGTVNNTYTGSNTTYLVNNLAPGSYTFTVSQNGCTSGASASVVINPQPALPSAPICLIPTQPTCTVATGSVEVNGLPSGNWTLNQTGSSNNSYNGTGSTYTVTGLAQGTYTFTVTNSAGCTSTASESVIINPQPVTPAAPICVVVTQPTCAIPTGSVLVNGLPSGNWTLTQSGSFPNIYTGSGSPFTITELAPGAYTFTVTNTAGCTSVSSANVVINPQPATPATPICIIETQPTCTVATGSVMINGLPSGNWTINQTGTVNNTYNGSGSSYTIAGLLAPGTYTFSVTNSAGCTSSMSETVVIDPQPQTPSAPIAATPTQPTCEVATGSVVLSGLPSGNWTINQTGTTNNTYNGSGSTFTVSGLATGSYTFSITNSVGCTSTSSVSVIILAQPNTPPTPICIVETQPTCTVATGSVIINGLPSGNWTINQTGTVNNTYNGSGSSYTIGGLLAPGTYTFSVTNSAGCTSAMSETVVIDPQPQTPSAPIAATPTQPTCEVATGSVVLSGLPLGNWTINQTGTANNTYNGSGATYTVSGLATGSYTFSITNSVGCTSTSSVSVIILAQPETPSVPVCIVETQPTCTVATGSVIINGLPSGNWTINQTGAANNTYNGTGSTFTVTGLIPGSYTFTITNNVGCTSTASETVIINPQPETPSAPIAATPTQPTCTLATGSVVLSGLPSGNWTINQTGTANNTYNGSGSTFTVSGLATGSYTFTITNSVGCTSVSSVNVIILAQPETPSAPIASVPTQPTCAIPTGSVIISGLPSGNWTINQAGTVINTYNGTGSTFTVSGLIPGSYTFTVTNSVECTSTASTSVTINPQPGTPSAPISGGDQTECQESPIQTLTATATVPAGQTIVWYDAAVGGNVVANPILNTVGTITYYAQTMSVDNCPSSTRTPVTLTITPAPVAPISGGDQTECEQSPIQTLTATATVAAGQSIVWYDAAVGGNVVANPILNTVGTVTYYAETSAGTAPCLSITRTSVTLTITPAPAAPITGGDQTECEQSPIQTLTATATVPAGQSIVWYDAAVGGNVVANPILNTVGTVTYYAETTAGTAPCSSVTRTAVTLTITPAPVAPITGGDQTECEESPIQTLTATATVPAGQTIVWYDAAVGGNVVANPILNTVGTVTYYAETSAGTAPCLSLTRTPVTLTITTAPVAPISGSDQTECEQSPIQTLTATATVPGGLTITWYDAAVGGNVVANPILNTVGTVTYYAEANGGTCVSLTRTSVTLTITPAPAAPITGGDQTECEQSPIQTLTATATVPAGQSIVWYDAAVGGNVVANPILNTVGTVTYYAETTAGTAPCSSVTRTAVTLTITPAPVAPITGGDQTECEESPIQTLTATATVPAGQTIVWYDAAVGGNVVANPILNTVGTVTYYAETSAGTAPCLSLTRTPVTLTITTAPVAPISGSDQTECEQSPIQTLTATATVPGGLTITWYDAAVGGNVVANPILNTVGTVTYYAEANGGTCVSLTRTSVTLTITPAPAAPITGGDQTECEQSPIQTLTATATVPAGQSIVWYDAAVGGNVVANPILNTVGTVTYYAETTAGTAPCSSVTRTAVTLTITPAPVAPITGGDQTECEESPIQTLTATATVPAGQTIVWYDAAVGGNVVANPILNTVGTVTYYAETSAGTAPCLSLTRTPVTLTITTAPVAPISGSDQTECEQSPIQTLTATATVPGGLTITWYDAAVGGNVVANPILNTVGTVTYYAEANGGTCVSLTRTSVTLTITPAPAAPITGGDQTECEQSPIQTLTATATVPAGQSIVWYDAAVGGNVVANPILNTVGTVTYYAETTAGTAPCSSVTRTAVTLTITPAPVAPITGGDQTECEESPIQTLTATATVPAGQTIVWYDAAVGGNVVANPILNTVGTVTYYAETSAGTAPCLSLTRTPVTLTITTAPVAPISGGDQTECEQSPIQTLTATATVPAGLTITWYDAAVGGNVVANPILNTVGTVTYYAEANGGTCVSLTRTSVTLTITPAPAAPITGGDQTECEQSPIQTLTATATVPAGQSIVWYDAAVGGNVVANPILNTVGTVTYYAETTAGAAPCSSVTRTAVTLTITPAPVAPITGGDQTECEESPIQTLTATATVPAGQTIVWYDAAVGGNVVANPILNTVGTVTYYAETTAGTAPCSSVTRTAVTLTITPAPAAPITGGDQTECEESPIQTLTATATVPAGQSIVWYDAAVGGNVVANPILNTVGTVTYYAETTAGAAPCSSVTRTAVTLTITPAPAAPITGGDQTECEESPIQTLTATATVPAGQTIVWYDAAVGGNVVANPILNTVGTVTYYAETSAGTAPCLSLTRTAVTLTITTAPVAPISGGDQTECEESPIQTLTATATVPAGQTVVWYDAAIGGNVVIPTLNTVGTITYYAEANGGTCVSLVRTPVTLTITPAPAAPISGGDQTFCDTEEELILTATATVGVGQTVVWYDAPVGGNIVLNPILSNVGTVTYYAETTAGTAPCSSLVRTPVTLTILAVPNPPKSGGDQTECETSPIQTLTATATVPAGQTVVWYDSATGGNIVVNPILNTVGTVTYWAEASEGICSSSSRTSVTLTINPVPAVPVLGQVTQPTCITATGTIELTGLPTGNWTINPGSIAGSGSTFIITNVAPGTYNFTVTTEAGCTSTGSVTVTINEQPTTPTAPVVGEITQPTCTVATGSVVLSGLPTDGPWLINGTISGTGPTYTVTDLAPGMYLFTVTNMDGCMSVTSIKVVINPQPATPPAPISGGDQTICNKVEELELIATATVPSGQTVVWYDAPVGGNVVTNPNLTTIGTVTYYAESVVTLGGCTSIVRTPVTLTILVTPEAPISGGDISECVTSPIQTLTATATVPVGQTIVWYDAITGGNIVTNLTLSTIGTVTFYAEASAGICTSAVRTPVTLTILPLADVPVSGGDITECVASPIQTLTALATVPVGQSVVWYDAATGGNIVTNPILNSIGSVTYYAEATAGICTSTTRTAVTLTIVDLPVAPVVGTVESSICDQTTGSVELTGLPVGDWTITQTGDTSNTYTGSGSTYLVTNLGLGTYTFVVSSSTGCSSQSIEVPVGCVEAPNPLCEPIIHNAISPNGDGMNDVFEIENFGDLTCFPTNSVEIYNRWGVLVYETNMYDNNSRAFRGYSEGRVTVDKGSQLPTGTYFYIIHYVTTEGKNIDKDGYLYLSR